MVASARRITNLALSPQEISSRHIYTVSELTQGIKSALESNFDSVWLEGEISNFKHHLSGHMYFSLKDEQSVISACLFRNVNERLKFKLEDGQKVICFGRVTVYGRRGQYQIVVEKIEPKGVGALQLAFQQLKEKLFEQGLFNDDRKRALPTVAFTVGIVTSSTGAAIRDILKGLKAEAGFSRIILRPTLVQGPNAKNDIVKAIEELNQYSQADVLIVGRGGGSLEDLWAFNEEVVANAIANSRIPVISAVGHEIDTTIADLVADLRAETPTAAARLIANKKKDALNFLEQQCLFLTNTITAKLTDLGQELNILRNSAALKHPLQRIEEFQQDVDNLMRSLMLATQHWVQITGEKFVQVLEKFQALNPISILVRGFSLTTTLEGNIIKEAACLKKGDLVKTKLAKGAFESEVTKVEKD